MQCKRPQLLMLSILLLTALSTSAQKNRPLAGDCISLIEILQTDYTLIDDNNIRTDRIIQDRKRVVSIIKNYLPIDYARPDVVSFTQQTNFLSDARRELKL